MYRWMFLNARAQSYLDIGVTRRATSRMAFESMLSKVGSGMKHLTDRYADYGAPIPDQHIPFVYEPPVIQTPEAASKHHYGGGHKNNAAMSALTLLAFLFFLHILQQCIKDHMTAMSTPQITIMTAGREGEDILKKSDGKTDKSGYNPPFDSDSNDNGKETAKNVDEETDYLTKINTAQPPNGNIGSQNYAYSKDFDDRKLALSGFVSAMTD